MAPFSSAGTKYAVGTRSVSVASNVGFVPHALGLADVEPLVHHAAAERVDVLLDFAHEDLDHLRRSRAAASEAPAAAPRAIAAAPRRWCPCSRLALVWA